MKKLFKKLLIGLVLGVGIYALGAIWVGVEKLSQALASFRYWLFIPVLGLTFANYLLRFCKWSLYLRTLNIQVPMASNLTIFLGGLSMTVTPGKIGELLKSYLLRETQGIPMARTAPVVLAERITDLLALVVLMISGIITFRRLYWLTFTFGGGILFFIMIISSRYLSLKLIHVLGKLPGLSRMSHKLLELYESTAILFRPSPLLIATTLSVAAWFCECLGFFIVLGGFPETGVPLLLAIFIYSATTLGGVITPGGLGITDGSMTALLSLAAALTAPIAGAATLIIRICTLWFAVLVGVLALLVFRRQVGLGENLASSLEFAVQKKD